MRPAPFTYVRPETIEEAVDCLHRHGTGAKVLSGGQSLLPALHQRLLRPSVLVDIGRLPGLRFVQRDGEALRVGALTTHRAVETADGPGVRAGFGVLAETARHIGHLPIRTRGTFGGSLAEADPMSEWCLLATLLDAEMTAAGPDGVRTIGAADFFRGAGRTCLRPDEVLIEIRLPRPATGTALAEFGPQDGALALVAAATSVRTAPDGTVTAARIALAGGAGQPVVVDRAGASLIGSVPGEAAVTEAARLAAEELEPLDDARAGRAYRKVLAATLTARALRTSLARAFVPDEEAIPAEEQETTR